MQQEVPAEKFTKRQQELSRLDGGAEIEGDALHDDSSQDEKKHHTEDLQWHRNYWDLNELIAED